MASTGDTMKPRLPPAPAPSSSAVRAVMRGNRSADTTPEVALRAALHRRGLRFFKNRRPTRTIPHRADVVFPVTRIAVFVDGCFWHSCPEHGTLPRTNTDYWQAKLARNKERDERVDRLLAEAGWQVVRVWEHEDAAVAADRVEVAVMASHPERFARSIQ